jgi:HD-GYP domain-containing protein (c-di-GMP phosphodiesterase class II)
MSRSDCERVREAARLHEVGLVYGDDNRLGTHQEETYRLVRGAGFPEEVCAWLLRTRERFDGGGPEGLAADAIPLESRLIRATCAFHAALLEAGQSDPGAGLERVGAQAGVELDPQVVIALAAVVERAAA